MNLTNNQKWVIGAVLMALMILTRSHHFASYTHLPDASWAVFFLAGVYLVSWKILPVFLGAAWLSDVVATTWGGVSDYCMTPGYLTLVAAYGALWFAGAWYRGRYTESLSTLVPLAASFLVGMTLCELFSSGGFYLFSGYFAEPTWTEFGSRVVLYYPRFLASAALYLGAAVMVHVFVRFVLNHRLDGEFRT